MSDRTKHAPPRRRAWNSNFPSYYRASLRWAMLIYHRREKLGYEALVSKMESILPEGRNTTKAGDRHVTKKVLLGFLGSGAETDDQNIIIMTEFIEIVLPDYIKTFTEEGCETLFGDTYLKFLDKDFSEKSFEKITNYIPSLTSVHIEEETTDGLIINYRRVGNSPYLKIWILGYRDMKNKFYKSFKYKPNAYSSMFSSTLEDATDVSAMKDMRTLFMLSGVIVPIRKESFSNVLYKTYDYHGILKTQDKDSYPIIIRLSFVGGVQEDFSNTPLENFILNLSYKSRGDGGYPEYMSEIYPEYIENPLFLSEFDRIHWGV